MCRDKSITDCNQMKRDLFAGLRKKVSFGWIGKFPFNGQFNFVNRN